MKGYVILILLIMIIFGLGMLIYSFFMDRKEILPASVLSGFRRISREDNPEEYWSLIREGKLLVIAYILLCIFFLIIILVYY